MALCSTCLLIIVSAIIAAAVLAASDQDLSPRYKRGSILPILAGNEYVHKYDPLVDVAAGEKHANFGGKEMQNDDGTGLRIARHAVPVDPNPEIASRDKRGLLFLSVYAGNEIVIERGPLLRITLRKKDLNTHGKNVKNEADIVPITGPRVLRQVNDYILQKVMIDENSRDASARIRSPGVLGGILRGVLDGGQGGRTSEEIGSGQLLGVGGGIVEEMKGIGGGLGGPIGLGKGSKMGRGFDAVLGESGVRIQLGQESGPGLGPELRLGD